MAVAGSGSIVAVVPAQFGTAFGSSRGRWSGERYTGRSSSQAVAVVLGSCALRAEEEGAQLRGESRDLLFQGGEPGFVAGGDSCVLVGHSGIRCVGERVGELGELVEGQVVRDGDQDLADPFG